jgi:hypothetical protein
MGMTTTGPADFSRALAARGWRYDSDEEEFTDKSSLVVEREELLALVPGMTPDDLAAWQDARWVELCQRLAM